MELAAVIQDKSLLKHPFYVLWLEGKLPKEALQKYAIQYYQLVAHLSRFISAMHSRCGDETVRKQLLRNLVEEEGLHQKSHARLWIDFAEEMGVDKAEINSIPLLPETKRAVATIMDACERSLATGAGALFAYEGQVPQISEEKILGLRKFYGINTRKALMFFEVHAVMDKKHAAVWSDLAKYLDAEKEAAESGKKTADALWGMFDGMYREFVPEKVKMSC